MKRNKRGFTLAELLIVVAIIAVLVAVAIPVFSKQLEKSRESVDFSNVRSAYAEVLVAAISDDASPLKQADGTYQAEIPIKQKQEDWQTDNIERIRIGDVPYAEWDSKMPTIGGTATVTFDPATDKVKSGTGSIPAFHGSANPSDSSSFTRGAVIQDDTGTCVILQGKWDAWTAYANGATVAELVNRFGSDAVSLNASNIKDSSSIGTLQAGDVYYHSGNDTFYYVNAVNPNEIKDGIVPNGSWVPLLQ